MRASRHESRRERCDMSHGQRGRHVRSRVLSNCGSESAISCHGACSSTKMCLSGGARDRHQASRPGFRTSPRRARDGAPTSRSADRMTRDMPVALPEVRDLEADAATETAPRDHLDSPAGREQAATLGACPFTSFSSSTFLPSETARPVAQRRLTLFRGVHLSAS